jgi:quinol monooxygenase YgiN
VRGCAQIAASEQGRSDVSVIMTFRTKGDPGRLEQHAAANADAMRAIAERAKEHGLIAHRFYGSEDTIMVVDEWPDPESFQKFFEAMRSEIEPMMQAVAVTGEPEVRFWRKLETHDDVGWD